MSGAARGRRERGAALERLVGAALARSASLEEALLGCCDALRDRLGAAAAFAWTAERERAVFSLRASAGLAPPPGLRELPPDDVLARLASAPPRRARTLSPLRGNHELGEHPLARLDGLAGAALLPLVLGEDLLGFVLVASRAPLRREVVARLGPIADTVALDVGRRALVASQAALDATLRRTLRTDAIGRLAAGVAHDFNNVLSVVLSHTELMLEDMKRDDPLRADVEAVRGAGGRAAGLARQLLAFSSPQGLEPRVLDPNDLLDELYRMLARLVREDVALVFTPGEGLGCARVDPGHFEQVVMNLVVTACEGMPRGGRITIETSNVTLGERAHAGRVFGEFSPGEHVAMTVRADGLPGEPAPGRSSLRAAADARGAGLELATVADVVRQNGGHLCVEGTGGPGTVVRVYFPRADAGAGARAVADAAVEVPTGRHDETVLVVEDDDSVRAVVLDVLRRQGYRVLDALDALDAIRQCETHAGPIDLVVTDVVMPFMNGAELAERLRAGRPSLRVLYTSGHADAVLERFPLLGPTRVLLEKPITPDALRRKAREALDAPPPRARTAASH